MSSVRRLLWWSSALCCVILVAMILVGNATQGRFTQALSTYGSGPEGARALYLTLSGLGLRPARWSQDLARLPARATLIALGTCQNAAARELSRYEQAELLSFVERGGVLIVAGARNYLPRALGVAFEDDRECSWLSRLEDAPVRSSERGIVRPADASDRAPKPPDEAEGLPDDVARALSELAATPGSGASDELTAVPMGQELQGLPLVPFRRPGRLVVEAKREFVTLMAAASLGPEQGTALVPLALTFTRGQGRVVVLSSANMLQNSELVDSEGAALFARLVRAFSPSDLVLFDEYHLGLGERRTLMQYLRQMGMLPMFAQLLLAVTLALFRAGARLGRVSAGASAQLAPGQGDFVVTLGRLYARVGDGRAAVRAIARGALAYIAQRHGLSNMPASALAQELQRRGAGRAAAAALAIARIGGSAQPAPLAVSVAQIDAERDAALSEPAGPATPLVGSARFLSRGQLR